MKRKVKPHKLCCAVNPKVQCQICKVQFCRDCFTEEEKKLLVTSFGPHFAHSVEEFQRTMKPCGHNHLIYTDIDDDEE